MDEDQDYELLPSQEVQRLKQELEKFKKNPIGDIAETGSLAQSIDNLNNNIKKLIEIFSNTESDLAKYYADNNPLDDIKAIKDQNEQIAQGLVAVADMVKEMKGGSSVPLKNPEQATIQPAPPQQYKGSPNSAQNFGYQQQEFPDFPASPGQPMAPPPFFDPAVPPAPEIRKGLFSRR